MPKKAKITIPPVGTTIKDEISKRLKKILVIAQECHGRSAGAGLVIIIDPDAQTEKMFSRDFWSNEEIDTACEKLPPFGEHDVRFEFDGLMGSSKNPAMCMECSGRVNSLLTVSIKKDLNSN